MPPKSKKRPSTSYESDDGIVAGSDDGGTTSGRSKSKRIKTEKTRAVKEDSQENASLLNKMPGGGMRIANGEEFWELSDKRRLVISTYNKKLMINIREYYEKDGKFLPGKKGISLPLDQFSTIISLLPNVETVLKAKGETLPRPDYDDKRNMERETDDDKEGQEAVEEDEETNGKKNFEQTSEED